MSDQVVLSVRSLSIAFGGLQVISDFSCDIKKGELAGLIGPNGAGKTTVFNILSGIYCNAGGEIEFWDREGRPHPLDRLSPARINRAGISRTFQNIRLFNNLSVLDNVRIALHNTRFQFPFDSLLHTRRFFECESAIAEKARALLALFKIEDKKDARASSLPYGEQRKLEIARAIASSPSLLLLDEPAAGMNPQETDELMKLISLLREKFDLSILLIEHDMRFVMGLCERLIVLDYGRIIAEGEPAGIRKNPAVIKAYLGGEALTHG